MDWFGREKPEVRVLTYYGTDNPIDGVILDVLIRKHSNEVPRALRQALGRDEPFTGRFDLPLGEDQLYLGRTSPVIEGLAGWTLDQALDPAAHERVREAARARGRVTIQPVLPVDILGAYVLLRWP